MLGVQNNPFHKANPFRLVQYERFQHPHLPGEKQHLHYHPNLYKDHYRPQLARPLENNWTFNENNLDKKYDFSRRPELTSSRVSDFEMKMKMSNIGVPSKTAQKGNQMQDSRIENPFYRKNLLINKDQVINQVEMDVSLYRSKARSSYQSVPISVTNITPIYQENPTLQRPRNSISQYNDKTENNPQYPIVNGPDTGSLVYSPDQTNRRPSYRSIKEEKQQSDEKETPTTITYKGKKFFLN